MKKIFIALLSISLVSVSFSNALTLKRGNVGGDVKALQEILAKSDVGFDATNVTGYYGAITEQAVANLQSKYGLPSVGYVGPKTTKVINILNELNQLPNNQAVNQSVPSQNINNLVNTNSTSIQSKNSTTVSYGNVTSGSAGVSLISSNQTSDVKNINQNEQASKSDDYKRVLNNNIDVKTGFVKPSFATSTNGVTKIIVRYKQAPTTAEENKIISAKGSKKKVYNLVPVISAEVADTDIDKISNDSNVLSIEKDEPVSINSDLEYLNTWGVSNTGAKTVNLSGFTGRGVKIAILDTGVDYNHSDLNLNYAGGFNFITGTTDTMDDNGHGTHISGTVSALNNNVGVIGEAPDAKIYALKVLDSTGAGYSSNVISALDWAVNNGVQVVNISFGTQTYPGTALEDAFINAEAKGLVVVASVGNSGTCAGDTDTVSYPARFNSVIAVGAIDSNNGHACFSSAGPKVELSAPGVNINSTILKGVDGTYSGTSMAAPHVSGAAADLISAGVKDLNGNGRINDEVRDILDKSALDLGSAGRDNIFGFGSVKIDNAIAYLASINSTTSTQIPTTVIPNTSLTSPIIKTAPVITNPTVTSPVTTPITTTPTTPKMILPVITPITTSPINIPVITPPVVMPRVIDNNSVREKLENELENIRKESQGNLMRETNSNSDNSHRSESSRRYR